MAPCSLPPPPFVGGPDTAVEYWNEKLQNHLPLLWRFNKQFILEGLSIILEFSYFYINGIYIHQIKGTAMRTKFSVVGSNLVVAYEEVQMFALLHMYIQKISSTFLCVTTFGL